MQDWLPESDFVHLVLDAVEPMGLSGFEPRLGRRGRAGALRAVGRPVEIRAYAERIEIRQDGHAWSGSIPAGGN